MAIQDNSGKWIVPYVIEPSAGVERGFLAILNEAYFLEELEDSKTRIVLKLKPHLAPVKAAVIPLKKNSKELVDSAKQIKKDLQKLGLGRVILENTGNIGKSYRKHDEIGTPVCVTVDFETLNDETVTIRDRDSMDQKRIGVDNLSSYITELINN